MTPSRRNGEVSDPLAIRLSHGVKNQDDFTRVNVQEKKTAAVRQHEHERGGGGGGGDGGRSSFIGTRVRQRRRQEGQRLQIGGNGEGEERAGVYKVEQPLISISTNFRSTS